MIQLILDQIIKYSKDSKQAKRYVFPKSKFAPGFHVALVKECREQKAIRRVGAGNRLHIFIFSNYE